MILGLGQSVTYAASNASLWGTIDDPVKPIQQVQKEEIEKQQQIEQQQQELAAQKTICELISGQPSLSGDTSNSKLIRDSLQKAYESALPEYKMFLVGIDAANNLYAQYRALYLKTYCQSGMR